MTDVVAGSAYQVELAQDALFVYTRIAAKSDEVSMDKCLDVLGIYPRIGRIYDPIYEAAMPPFPVYVIYAGHYGIYYEIDDDRRRVDVVFIEDQRRNPNSRFTNIRLFYGDGI